MSRLADLMDSVRESVARLEPEFRSHFRRLHARPELGWQEEATAAYVEAALLRLGLRPSRIARTGVVADIDPASDVPMRALRADVDALSVSEASGLAYASERPGVMHACGHDAHTAILLGAAGVLCELDSRRRRPVRLVFQPAEEVVPSGAERMVEEEVLDRVESVIGLHVWPSLPSGTVGLREGVVAAAADTFECRLRGPGGHGARPHETVDLIALAARLVPVLLDIPRSRLDPLREPAVVSIGRIHGGDSFNVLPGELSFGGTIRTFEASTRKRLPELLEETLRAAAQAAGAGYDLSVRTGPPAVRNDPALASLGREAVVALFGEQAVRILDAPSMGSEDFGHFTARVPGLLLRLGCVPEGEPSHPLHSSRFRVDEDALATGVAVMAALALA